MILEAQTYPTAWSTTVTNTFEPLGWSLSNKGFCIGMLIVYCAITNFFAYVALKVRRDDFLILRDIYEYCNVTITKFWTMLKPTMNNVPRTRLPTVFHASYDSQSLSKILARLLISQSQQQDHQYDDKHITNPHDICEGTVIEFAAESDDVSDDNA